MFRRHPSYAALNQFADGDLVPPQQDRVAAHLARCGRCRGEVAFIRQAGQMARSLETPSLPDDLLGRIRERRQAGERVILPLESPGARSAGRWRLVPTAAAIIALLAVGLYLSTGFLEADRTGLRILPQRPEAGDSLTVEYDGGYEFSDLDRLTLRARFVTRTGRAWQQVGGIMTRDEDGPFRTRFALADSVVYAAFAVENALGDRADNNGGRLWDVMVYGPDDNPTLDALTQRYLDTLIRDASEAERSVDALTELYPESPRGWWFKAIRGTLGSGEDSVTAFYRDKLRELERRFVDDPPADPDEFAFLALFAGTMGEAPDLQHWVTEAERRGARSRWLAQARTYLVLAYDRPSPPELLRELEAIWQESPVPVGSIAINGFGAALMVHDLDAAFRWLVRYREAVGFRETVGPLANLRETFGPEAALEWALDHAEAELLRREAYRPLTRTVPMQERALDTEWQELLAIMADMAAATGQPRLARDLAAQGLDLAWDTEALATIGRVLLSAGDTASATTAFARVAADPAAPPIPAEVTSRADWTELVTAARSDLARYVLGESVVRYLPEGVAPDTGPGVVAFLADCSKFGAVLRELPRDMLTIYAATDLDSVRGNLAECGLETLVRPDPGARIREAYGLGAFQAVFVTDAVGRVRFSQIRAEDLPRDLMALSAEKPAAAD